uniref:Uncharacterized protein n=1 Tax=viral metagenome TaxID=1070528 RepID=A0A6C0IEL4_9ZZZZ
MSFAKIYPELLESILLNENLVMELGNVTSRTNNLMEEIIEDLVALNKASLTVPPLNTPLNTSLNTPLNTSLRPDFMSPRARNYSVKPSESNSKKRTFDSAFGEESLEDGRYGQHISANFFVNNIGHNTTNLRSVIQNNNNNFEYDFVAYYQANRNLFNV